MEVGLHARSSRYLLAFINNLWNIFIKFFV